MCRTTNLTYHQSLVMNAYIAYYGRPPDPEGFDYWTSRLDQAEGDLQAIIPAFANSAEYTQRYGHLDNEALLTAMYQQLFGRVPDTKGLQYYLNELNGDKSTNELNGNKSTVANIVLDLLNGAQNQDLQRIDHKKAVSTDYYLNSKALNAHLTAEQLADIIAPVSADPASVIPACEHSLTLLNAQVGDSPQILQLGNFYDNPAGSTYQESDITADFGYTPTWSNGLDEGRVTMVSVGAENRLEVSYPANQVGTGSTGAQFQVKVAPQETLCLSYKVRFDEGFDFSKGGKLPGLAGGEANTGQQDGSPNPPDGSDGFSSRVMWGPDGILYSYSYLFAATEGGPPVEQHKHYWTTDQGENVYITPGQEHTIQVCVEMNSVSNGQAVFNGSISALFDGTEVLNTEVAFRNVETLAADVLYFSTFRGGKGDDWASDGDHTIQFWDFILSDGLLYIAHDPEPAAVPAPAPQSVPVHADIYEVEDMRPIEVVGLNTSTDAV